MAWTPYFKLDITYNTNEVEMNYALWNAGSRTFDKNMEKSTYALNHDNMVRLLASKKEDQQVLKWQGCEM